MHNRYDRLISLSLGEKMLRTHFHETDFTEDAVFHRKTYHHGNLKKALIKKSLEIIKDEGVAGLSLRKAARGVGVSHAAPAHHFGDLVGLLVTIAQEGFELLLNTIDRNLEANLRENPLVQLKSIGLSYIAFALEHTHYFKVMFSSRLAEQPLANDMNRISRKVCHKLADSVVQCQESRLMKAEDPMKIALFLWTSIHGYATLCVDGKLKWQTFQSPGEDLAKMVVDRACSGLLQV